MAADKERTWSFLRDVCAVPEEASEILVDEEDVKASFVGEYFDDFNKSVRTAANYVFTNLRLIIVKYYEFDFTDNQIRIQSIPWTLVDSWHTDMTDAFNEERARVYQEKRGAEWQNLGWEATVTVRTRVGEDWKFRIADHLVDDEHGLADFDHMIADCVF